MRRYPQIAAFQKAARALRNQRYWAYADTEEELEFLRALDDVVRECCYHLDKFHVLSVKTALDEFRQVARLIGQPAANECVAELILMPALDAKIRQISAGQ